MRGRKRREITLSTNMTGGEWRSVSVRVAGGAGGGARVSVEGGEVATVRGVRRVALGGRLLLGGAGNGAGEEQIVARYGLAIVFSSVCYNRAIQFQLVPRTRRGGLFADVCAGWRWRGGRWSWRVPPPRTDSDSVFPTWRMPLTSQVR